MFQAVVVNGGSHPLLHKSEERLPVAEQVARVAEREAVGITSVHTPGQHVALAEKLVDAIGTALGVDTGTIPESQFEEAILAAARILEQEARS
jgi:hypothetical protein